MIMLIDPPTPFAPDAEWLEFRDSLRRADQSNPQIADALEEVAEELTERGIA